MCAASLQSEAGAEAMKQPRVRGGVRVSFLAQRGRTALDDCEERDGYRIRFPRGGAGCEGIIVNTGGGVAGGDRVTHTASLGEDTAATIATPAAERIYRSQGDASQIDVAMTLMGGASLAWLPQETILYAKANLSRRFEIDMAVSAALLMAEITVFGRKEMGEAMSAGSYADRWRVRRGGQLVFAENVRFEGDLAAGLSRPAIGGGARVAATVLYVAGDAEDKLPVVRGALSGASSRIAASAWNGLLCIRCLGAGLEAVRRDVCNGLAVLRKEPMPRIWSA